MAIRENDDAHSSIGASTQRGQCQNGSPWNAPRCRLKRVERAFHHEGTLPRVAVTEKEITCGWRRVRRAHRYVGAHGAPYADVIYEIEPPAKEEIAAFLHRAVQELGIDGQV